MEKSQHLLTEISLSFRSGFQIISLLGVPKVKYPRMLQLFKS